jgi:diketogulonate reductase-like aldo/keto reductase
MGHLKKGLVEQNNDLGIPPIGQGCMGIGGEFSRDESKAEEHLHALQFGIDLGLTFLDTAEIYSDGYSEELIGRVAKGRRDKLFIATKFSPKNSSYQGVLGAAESSLTRLQTDYIDLYQIHWPNPAIPIEETVSAMERLVDEGKIRYIGVSNFSKREMIAAQSSMSGNRIVSNQLEYNLFDRFIEQDILPHCRREKSLVIAYSPLDKGRTTDGDLKRNLLQELSVKYEKTPSQIALNWLISQQSVVAIPKSTNLEHIKQNAESAKFEISGEDKLRIDEVCTPTPIFISPQKIRVSVSGEGGRSVYQTIEEARANLLGLSPSPLELAEFIRQAEPTKPVRVIPSIDTSSGYTHDLVEGRLRYWAWVLAFNGEKPVPAYVRYD